MILFAALFPLDCSQSSLLAFRPIDALWAATASFHITSLSPADAVPSAVGTPSPPLPIVTDIVPLVARTAKLAFFGLGKMGLPMASRLNAPGLDELLSRAASGQVPNRRRHFRPSMLYALLNSPFNAWCDYHAPASAWPG